MKIQTETTLFKVLSGSRMYGTNSENSDYDYKAICLPSLNDILLNKTLSNRKVRPEGLKAGDKMLLGEDETEYVPLTVFFDDFYHGQTYAFEVAFAVLQHKAVFKEDINEASKHFIYNMVKELVDKFLTNSVKKMVGYAVAQSKLYGLKSERYSVLEKVHKVLKEANETCPDATFQLVPDLLNKLLEFKYVTMTEIHSADINSKMVPAVDIMGKQYLLTNKMSTIFASVDNTLSNYGERVKQFKDAGAVDWKALSHAIRITEQVLDLCSTGKLEFPRPNAQYLKDVKEGKVSIEDATETLQQKFLLIDSAVEQSILPEKTPELNEAFTRWKLEMLYVMYNNDFENIVTCNRKVF